MSHFTERSDVGLQISNTSGQPLKSFKRVVYLGRLRVIHVRPRVDKSCTPTPIV